MGVIYKLEENQEMALVGNASCLYQKKGGFVGDMETAFGRKLVAFTKVLALLSWYMVWQFDSCGYGDPKGHSKLNRDD